MASTWSMILIRFCKHYEAVREVIFLLFKFYFQFEEVRFFYENFFVFVSKVVRRQKFLCSDKYF